MLPENILFSEKPADDLWSLIREKNYSKVVALVDENTNAKCLPILLENGELFSSVIEIQSGEENKTLNTCETIWEKMTDLALDRHAALVVIGGGVLGDMGGFCAATYKRGIDFVLVPTTLLAQVDASVGGKLGIDYKNFKNHIGVFQQPVLTLIYNGFLRSLPVPELRSGFAEVIKHCLISDNEMWTQISKTSLDEQPWHELTKHSVAFKARITTEDPTEKGLRKILNAGHTIGHAVESYLLFSGQRILHGEAIAVGLIAESYIARVRDMITPAELSEIEIYILSIFGKVNLTKNQIEMAASYAVQDKKNKGNKVLCVLPQGIGKAAWDFEINTEEIKTALTYYSEL